MRTAIHTRTSISTTCLLLSHVYFTQSVEFYHEDTFTFLRYYHITWRSHLACTKKTGEEHSDGKQDTNSVIDIEKRNYESLPTDLVVSIKSHWAVTSIGRIMKSGI